MPKRVFWPAAFVTAGLIYLASTLRMLPAIFADFWPLLFIVVGLGGLLISDSDEWTVTSSKPSKKSAPSRKTVTKVTAKKKALPKKKK